MGTKGTDDTSTLYGAMDVCTDYDIPVLDMNLESGIYYHSEEYNTVSLYFGDGVHPNDAGHAILAESIYEALLAMHISFE